MKAIFPKPSMLDQLKPHLQQSVRCFMSQEEISAVEDAYKMFYFHVMFKNEPQRKRRKIVFDDQPCSDGHININLSEIRGTTLFNKDDDALYYAVVDGLAEAFYPDLIKNLKMIIEHRKSMR